MFLIFTWIFSKTLSWLISSLLADPNYHSELIRRSHLVSWPSQHYEVLDFLSMCWNVAPCLGDTGQNAHLKRKPLILISYICTIHPQVPPWIFWSLVYCQMNHGLMLYWKLMMKKNTFFSSFSSCSLWNVFSSW